MKVLKGIIIGLVISLGITQFLSFNAYADPPKHIQETITNQNETTVYNPNITQGEKMMVETTTNMYLLTRWTGACFFTVQFIGWIMAWRRMDGEAQAKAVPRMIIGAMLMSIEPIVKAVTVANKLF